MSTTELEQKIQASSAWLSIQAERRDASTLASLKWAAVHNCFYTDPVTEKLREIDVVAMQVWKRAHEGNSVFARLHLVIECRSAAGYHILISPIPEPEPKRVFRHTVWIGEE